MIRILIALLLTTSLFMGCTATSCVCGRGHTNPTYVCHKCPCECPNCDYTDCEERP